MNTLFEKNRYGFSHLLPYEDKELRARFDELAKEAREKIGDSLETLVPIRNIETTQISVGEMQVFEDYDILTSDRLDKDGNLYDTEEEYSAKLKELAEEEFEGWKVAPVWLFDYEKYTDEEDAKKAVKEYNELWDETKPLSLIVQEFGVIDAEGDLYDDETYETEAEALERLEGYKTDWIEDECQPWDELEQQHHEVYWNYVWRYNNSDPDHELAAKLGLGVLEVRTGEHEEDSFLFLRGCGMDLSPLLIAYKALEYGGIDESDLSKLRDREYFEYVVPSTVLEDVKKALNLTDFWI